MTTVTIEQEILFYAFRYALGRMTFAPHDVGQAIIMNKDWLDERIKKLIIKETTEALDKNQAGMEVDREMWQKVVKELA